MRVPRQQGTAKTKEARPPLFKQGPRPATPAALPRSDRRNLVHETTRHQTCAHGMAFIHASDATAEHAHALQIQTNLQQRQPHRRRAQATFTTSKVRRPPHTFTLWHHATQTDWANHADQGLSPLAAGSTGSTGSTLISTSGPDMLFLKRHRAASAGPQDSNTPHTLHETGCCH